MYFILQLEFKKKEEEWFPKIQLLATQYKLAMEKIARAKMETQVAFTRAISTKTCRICTICKKIILKKTDTSCLGFQQQYVYLFVYAFVYVYVGAYIHIYIYVCA